MKLRAILRSDFDAAVRLLCEGFPLHSPEMWQECLMQLFVHVEQGWNGSIGNIASAGGADIGICLSIPSIRRTYEPSPRDVINLACFYLRPGNEWMTTLFMRRIMTDSSPEYTDLTASTSMRQILRQLGFHDSVSGMTIVPTLLAAFQPSHAIRILPIAAVAAETMLEKHLRVLEDHNRLHTIALAVEFGSRVHPLILALGKHRRLPSARIVLARDRELIRAAAGPLARHLLKRGIAFLEIDSPNHVRILGSRFATEGALVQTTRAAQSPAIDHTYSELVFVPSPRSRPIMRWLRRRHSYHNFFVGVLGTAVSAAAATLVFGLPETNFI